MWGREGIETLQGRQQSFDRITGSNRMRVFNHSCSSCNPVEILLLHISD
jgi:hypothetical protein